MLRPFHRLFGLFLVLFVASCSGGGCSGNAGCGGATPLPGGFPRGMAIENAASVRISRPGLDFLEQNVPSIASRLLDAPSGVLSIPISETPFNQPSAFLGIDVVGTFCPGGPNAAAKPPRCTGEVNIGGASFRVDAVKPNVIELRGTVPLRLEDTPIQTDFNPGPAVMVHVGYGANGTCTVDQPAVAPKSLPVRIVLPLVQETVPPRNGYTKVDVDNALIDLDAISGDDVRICVDCGLLNTIPNLCNGVLNWSYLKNTVVNSLKAGLDAQIKASLRQQLCTKPDPTLNPPCPTGSRPDAEKKTCVYDVKPAQCVPALLGTDAHVNLGAFLSTLSPGTAGALDFGLAAGGAMNPAPGFDLAGQRSPNGVSLALVGGVLPMPTTKCVPLAPVQLPTGIPVPDEIAPPVPEGPQAPHVGIALANRFLSYAFTSAYNSGLLCLNVSTEQVSLLKSALLSLLIPSLKTLTFEQQDAAAAIVTRPLAPPSLTLGGGTDVNRDPLVVVSLPRFAVDFYVWSYDRFVRAFTFQGDLAIPLNLQTGRDPQRNPNGGLLPVVGDIRVGGGVVTNADALLEQPATIANIVRDVLGGLSKQLMGAGVPPIDLSPAAASLGLGLEINAVRKLTKGQDEFLGIFGTMTKTQPTAFAESDTTARLVAKNVEAAALAPATYRREAMPELHVELASSLDDGRRPIEYAWWIDHGTRSAWSSDPHLVVKDDQLLLQGKHVLRVVSRVAGRTETEDSSPAEVPFAIDTLPPFAKVERVGTAVALRAWDLVADEDALVARVRLDGGAFGPWQKVSDLGHVDVRGARVLEAEVKDEEGNVRSIREALAASGSVTDASSGCACATPGSTGSSRDGFVALVLGAVAVAGVALRRRPSARAGRALRPAVRVKRAAAVLGALSAVAATSQGCSCGSSAKDRSGCGADCKSECLPPLEVGLPGAYTSVAKASDGTIWVAGYNDALLTDQESYLFGDLVVGKYDQDADHVLWETVDGVPERTDGTCPSHVHEWRGGETDSGDDVGLWTTLQVSAEGHPMVAYYDATNKRLKFAYEDDGWHAFVLKEDAAADIGRYAKMAIVDGRPVVAFLHVEPARGGKMRSKVVVARSNVATPHGDGDFSFEDTSVDEEGPCTATSCAHGEACVKSTGACTATVDGCVPKCGATQACVDVDAKATCVDVRSSVGTYPKAMGDYVSIAHGPEGLGIVGYDATHGNLIGIAEAGAGIWERRILDGEMGNRGNGTAVDTGDVGVASSLTIASDGTWHVSYVNALDNSLRYVTYAGGKATAPQVVDDGTGVAGRPFPDGKHAVGDDSVLRVDGDVVTIFYQDATLGTLRKAVGVRAGATRRWDLKTIAQPGRLAGFFPQIIPNDDRITNFWRQTDRSTKSIVGDVSIVRP